MTTPAEREAYKAAEHALQLKKDAADDMYEALKYPRFGDTAALLESAAKRLELASEEMSKRTGKDWSPIGIHHFYQAAKIIREALARAEGREP